MARSGRPVVLLNRRAVWGRLESFNRSQGWLAREVGVSPSYMSRLLRQGRAPSGRVRRRLQRVLGFGSFDDLFVITWEDQPDAADSVSPPQASGT